MSLRPSVIDVPLLTLNQTPADRQGPVGRLTDAKNVVVTHYDARSQPAMVKVQQRNGFIGMPTVCRSPVTGATTSTAWSNPELLSSIGRQLLSVCNAVPRAWNETAFTAYDRQRVVPNRLEADVFHTSQKTIQAEDSAWLAGITCSVWTETVVLAQTAVDFDLPKMLLYIGFKDDNGAWVIPPRLLFDPGTTPHTDPTWNQDNKAMAKVAQDGALFWVVYNAQTGPSAERLVVQVYNTSGELLDDTFVPQLAPIPGDISYWDIQADNAGGIVVAQPASLLADSGVSFATFTYDAGITATSALDATIHCTGPLAWLTNNLDDLHYLATVAEGETETLFAYQITAMAQTHEYDYGFIPSRPDSMSGWVRAGGVADQPTAFVDFAILPTSAATDGPPFDPQLRYTAVRSCTWGGAVVDVKQENSVIPMSRAFLHDGDYYAMTYYQSGSGLLTGATTDIVSHTAGDYMIGEATQSITVSPGDYVSGSPKSLAGTFLSLRGDSVGSRGITAGSSVSITVASGLANIYGIPDGTVVAAWVLTGYAPAWKQGARLVVAASNIATANGTFDVYANVTATSTVYTSITSVAGVAIIPGALTTGTYDVPLVWGYCAPSLPGYVDDGSLSLLTGGQIVVTGTFAQNGTFTIIRATNGGNNYLNYGTPVSPQLPTVWVTQTTQTGFDGMQAYSMQIQAPIANLWNLDMPEAIGGTLSVSGDSVPANNGDFLITTTSGGDNITGNETVLQPEIYTASTLPTITLTLPLDIIPFTFYLQSLALDYTVIGATLAISGATPEENNGAYLITAVNLTDGTFYAQPLDGRTGIVSLDFTGAETITITYPASVSPEFQPTYFMTPLEDVDTAQVGRFEAGIAYGDWRFDGSPGQESYFPLSLSTPQLTNDGIQVVLPYRAESFTSTVSTVAPTGSVIPVAASSSVSTVGLKAYTLSLGVGQAAPSGSALLLPGPLAGEFTASGFHENGVNIGPEAPFLISQQVSSSPVAQTPGTVRQYVVVFEDTDESGDRVFSIPSPALNVTLVGDATSVTIGGRLPVPLDTSGVPIPTHYGPTNRRGVGISIYATSYQGGVPTTQRYKITNDLNVNGLAPISITNASGFAFPDEFSWTYTDENPSANILTGEVLYTDKGYLPRFPAPASRHFSTWKNRTFAAGYDGALWMSGEKTEGDATWFFPAFRFIFGNDVPLASAPMDDYLVVTCAASVWIIPSQQLPDGTGRNGVMPTPIQLPFQNGGQGLAVALRSGVAYTSTAGGVWLITRDLKNIWLSQPIQDSLTIEPTSMAVDENQRLHIATGTSGHFVYDQVVDAWYRWALPTASAEFVAILDGQVAWQDSERVALYTPSVYADDINEVTYGIAPDVTFSSLQFGNVRGLKACWAFIIQGTYKGPHNLNVVIGYPDENPDAEDTLFGPFAMTNTGPYVVEANPKIEEASSYNVRVYADFDGVAVPANTFEFEVLSAEVGFDRSSGVNKPTKQMRAT